MTHIFHRAAVHAGSARTLTALVALVALTTPALAQDAGTAAAPDPSARCDLAFSHVREGRYAEARDAAAVAIDALHLHTDAASLRLLGACLYNRGRAYEGLGERANAVTDYAESLEVRPNASVTARLGTLVSGVPAAVPLAAIATLEQAEGDPLVLEDASPTSARTRDHTRIGFATLATDDGHLQRVYATARLCGAPRVAALDEVSGGAIGRGYLEARSARAQLLGDVDAIVVQMEGIREDNHGEETPYRSTAIVFIDACALRVALFVTDDDDSRLRLRFDRAGNVITSHRGPIMPPSPVGTFRIRDIAH